MLCVYERGSRVQHVHVRGLLLSVAKMTRGGGGGLALISAYWDADLWTGRGERGLRRDEWTVGLRLPPSPLSHAAFCPSNGGRLRLSLLMTLFWAEADAAL